jgi:RND superfamily putative drug exporter
MPRSQAESRALAAVARASHRHPLLVITAWLVLVAGCFAVGLGVFTRLEPDVGAVPGSESDRAYALLREAGPQPVVLTAIVTSRSTVDGRSTSDLRLREAITAAVADLRGMPGVAEVTEPLPSTATGGAVLVRISLLPDYAIVDTADAVAERLRRIDVGEVIARQPGASQRSEERTGPRLSVIVAGGPLTENEFNAQAQSDVQRAELLTTPIVLLLLVLIFGGLRAAGLPLVVAVVGVGGTFAILYGFSVIGDVSVYAIQVATMLSVGLAVDYGLLTVSRFREERAAGLPVAEAVVRAGATAGHTVVYSGLTVAAVLAGLLVFPDSFLRSMGLAGVAVVAVVVAAAVTLLPALLAVVGHRITPAKPRQRHAAGFARIARAVQRRPAFSALVAAGAMLLLAVPVADLRLGQIDARLLPQTTQTRQLHDAIATHYPELYQPSPLLVVADAAQNTPGVALLRDRIEELSHITSVETVPAGSRTLLRAALDEPGHTGAAQDAVAAIRAMDAPFEVAVGGDAALLHDYQEMLADRLPYAVLVIVVGTLLLLFWYTGSVLLPVKAVLTNLLSIGAALGAVVWVFQQGHLASWLGTEGLDATHLSVPVLVGAIAFGLSVDYEVFLLSRIRERWLAGAANDAAVAQGLQRTGRVITSAALLLCVVFAGFLVAGFVPVKAIGLGLVLAVALDATVVRLVLVPATMTMLGRYNWWPARSPGPIRAEDSAVHNRLSTPVTQPVGD